MINDIIHGVSVALYTEFGDGHQIVTEDTEQGLIEPCFFIAVLRPSFEKRLGAQYQQVLPLDIHYFPADPGDNELMMDVAERAFSCLELITLKNGDKLWGTGMSSEIVDGVLHVFVSYGMNLRKTVEQDPMQSLDTNFAIEKSD